MKPDIATYNPDPAYLRELLEKIGLTQNGAARTLGISERSMRYYLANGSKQKAPYVVQFALECLAGSPQIKN